ncbi:hypothetical protein B0H19DRAFT_1245902 [Mycena capillaripes]|nr:hypothetical protein B0H19DRAFT_1245902 [Mycena capillaripes]
MSSRNTAEQAAYELTAYEFGQDINDLNPLSPDIALSVFLCYDHLLTLESEINYIWKRPKRLSFFLFVILRYLALLSNFGMLYLKFGEVPLEKCLFFIAVVLDPYDSNLLVGYMFAVRVYAMYNFSKIILCFLCVVGLTTVILAAVRSTALLPSIPQF